MNHLSETVIVTWNESHDLVTIALTKTDPQSVDAYIEANLNILRQWKATDAIYKIQDFSQHDVRMNPYLRTRLQEIYVYIRQRQLNVRVAVVLGTNVPGHILTLISRVSAITTH
ncbi:MAG: hypothetical protein KC496_21485, partial [Anaerolineae bacterium]|nr:hypothetical protein [Anaerolineae bacterium]